MPWWNRFCEAAWQHKITCWQRNDTASFTQASLAAHSTYSKAIQDYRVWIQNKLQQHLTSRCWWSLTKSLTGSTSAGQPMTPPAHQLAAYFSSKTVSAIQFTTNSYTFRRSYFIIFSIST